MPVYQKQQPVRNRRDPAVDPMELLFTVWVLLLAQCSLASTDSQFELADSGAAVCPASAPVVAQPAGSDRECAVLCAASDACKSFSHVTLAVGVGGGSVAGSCLMSGRDNCSFAAGSPAFKKSGPDCNPSINGSMAAGSTVQFMQRFLGNVNFARPWADYEAGFGNCAGDFWQGLRNIKILLGSSSATWRVEMKLWSGADMFVEYSGFTVGAASTNYTMSYTTMASHTSQVTGDAMSSNNGCQFSTIDRDNDLLSGSCSQMHTQGGFWFANCGRAFPTSEFPTAENTNIAYMTWYTGTAFVSLKEIRMFLKR